MSSDVMATTEFGLIFEGPALEHGEIPVADLAGSLLALGEVLSEASALLYPSRKRAVLHFKASRQGSVAVDLILAPNGLWDQLKDIFSGDDATAIVNIKELVIGAAGLIAFIKLARGRTPFQRRNER